MFHEYAIDPQVLSSWDRVRYFLDALGPWKGRFLADYPHHWKRKVLKSLRCPDIEKHRIIERLKRLDDRVFSVRIGSVYDGTQAWLDNARTEHLRVPFHAIISTATNHPECHILPSDVDESHELWGVPSGRFLPRDPVVFAEALKTLIAASRKIALVDPYFRADHGQKTAALLAFAKLVRAQPHVAVDVHASESGDLTLSYAEQKRHAERVLPQVLPAGVTVTLHCWRERAGGARLHNRYLLTDVGGVQFGDGIELGARGQEDRVSILSEEERSRLWSLLYGDVAAFDSSGTAIAVVGRKPAI